MLLHNSESKFRPIFLSMMLTFTNQTVNPQRRPPYSPFQRSTMTFQAEHQAFKLQRFKLCCHSHMIIAQRLQIPCSSVSSPPAFKTSSRKEAPPDSLSYSSQHGDRAFTSSWRYVLPPDCATRPHHLAHQCILRLQRINPNPSGSPKGADSSVQKLC